MNQPPADGRSGPFPIRTVAELTGVNAVTLRAWERRYGLVTPARTPKGHRLYSAADVDRIHAILAELARGTSIGRVADRLGGADAPSREEPYWIHARRRMVDGVSHFDEAVLDAVYDDAIALYPVDIVTSQLLIPLLRDLGERWDRAPGGVAEEHFFSVFMRNKLGARFHHRHRRGSGPVLVAACLPGEHHEFGLLLFALAAHDRGFRVVLLGADTPLEQVPPVLERTGARALVLSGSRHLDAGILMDQLHHLVSRTSIPLFVGGSLVASCADAVRLAGAMPLPEDLGQSVRTVRQALDAAS